MREERLHRTPFAEVAVDAPVGRDRTFTYSIPHSLRVLPGQIVTVPFGARKTDGVVITLAPRSEVAETREILDVPASVPTLTKAQLQLARWISNYYYCPLFDAVSLMLPPGGRRRFKTYLEIAQNSPAREAESLTELESRIFEYVRRKGRVEESKLVAAYGKANESASRALVRSGLLVRSHGPSGSAIRQRTRRLIQLADGQRELAHSGLDEMGKRAPRQTALLEFLLRSGSPVELSAARKEYGHGAVKGLQEKGWLDIIEIADDRDPLAGLEVLHQPSVTLTTTQQVAAAEINATLSALSKSTHAFLLQGVTGSGKTEVYLDAVRHCLEIGKRAIVLVPEIALTGQTVERFAARFPGNVAVLHSGLTAGERFDQWTKVRQGKYGVVIGSRSAIFAPVADLGLIVTDEEHEWTYKQHDASPRYHDRLVALKLAELHRAVVVMGSATPDVESYFHTQKGRLRLLELPQRVAAPPASDRVGSKARGLATVQVVDMRRELREGHRSMLSRELLAGIRRCLDTESQVILFLNRRGSATSVQCQRCGFSLKCRRCDIPLSYHKDIRRMLCHYCGERRQPPQQCPQCLTYHLARYGVGTQAVVSELARQFPEARTIRWDSDAAKGPKQHRALLEGFRSGNADILVGTQMIAKGLHFPSVTLVGVVLADVGLAVPDFRVGERTFQVLCQVAGRSGRGANRGRAIIQTYQPDNYAIKAAATQDYARFYREEIVNRRMQGNPPYGRLIRLMYAHTNQAVCEREATRLAGTLREQRDSWGYADVEILGPTPAYPARVRGRYRWQLVLRGAKPRTVLDKAGVPPDWVVDVDPVGPG